MKNFFTTILICLIITLIVFSNTFFIVYENEQAIITQFGKVISKKILTPGLHFKIPVIQKVLIFEKRILNLEPEAREVIAMDQKRVIVDSYVKYKITDPLRFYQTVGNEMNLQRRISPIVESRLREEIGKVLLINLISKDRSKTMDLVESSLKTQVQEYGIEIVDLRIKKTDLPSTNSEAIFRRMQTDRIKEARELRAEGNSQADIIKANANKERAIIISSAEEKSLILRGKAESSVIKMYNEVYSKDRNFFLFMKYMDTYQDSFDSKNTYFILKNDPKNSFMKFFNGIN